MNFEKRVVEVFAEENANPEGWWYLSFAGDEGFRGATIVRGRGVLTASLIATSYEANPGGEVLAIDLGSFNPPEPKYCNKLLNLEQLREAFSDDIVNLQGETFVAKIPRHQPQITTTEGSTT